MREIADLGELKKKYLGGNRATKNQILNSLCLLHGYHRKSAIRLMSGELRRLVATGLKPKPKRTKPGTKSLYGNDPGFCAALKSIWRETDYMCSKNLKKAMPVWLPAFEEVQGNFREDIRVKLLKISPASIDRVLKPYKHLGRGRCGTKPGSLLECPKCKSQMRILAFLHDPLEIKNIMKSQGIPDYTAPPPIPDFSRHSEVFDEMPDYD